MCVSRSVDSVYLDMANECKRIFKVPDVNIVFVDEVRPNEPNLWGIYRWWDKSITIKKRADILSMLETICHEIVHHIQYRSGELFFGHYVGGKRVSIYKGVEYVIDTSHDYWTAPWEVDARKYQIKMFDHFSNKAPVGLLRELQAIQLGK